MYAFLIGVGETRPYICVVLERLTCGQSVWQEWANRRQSK